jgi:hypothetical protein
MAVFAAHTRLHEPTDGTLARGRDLAREPFERFRRGGWASFDQCLVGAANFITILVFARYLHPHAFAGFMLGYAGLVAALFLQPRADRDRPWFRRSASALVVLQAKRCIGISLGLTLAGCMVLAAGHEVAGGVVIALALAALPCLGQDLVRRVLHACLGGRAAVVSDGFTYGLQVFGALVLVSAAAQWSTAGSALTVLGLSSAVGLVVGCWQLRRHVRVEAGRERRAPTGLRSWISEWLPSIRDGRSSHPRCGGCAPRVDKLHDLAVPLHRSGGRLSIER